MVKITVEMNGKTNVFEAESVLAFIDDGKRESTIMHGTAKDMCAAAGTLFCEVYDELDSEFMKAAMLAALTVAIDKKDAEGSDDDLMEKIVKAGLWRA